MLKFTNLMIHYNTTILKFKEKGEKSGWTYIEVPADVAAKMKPGNKKSFRVKGKLDNFPIQRIALIPMGRGSFIMPLNAALRKGIGKRHGAMLKVELEEDKTPLVLDKEFMECLTDEPVALAFFKKLPPSHQHYFSRWIASAKTESTKAKRIAMTLNGLSQKMSYSEMMRAAKNKG